MIAGPSAARVMIIAQGRFCFQFRCAFMAVLSTHARCFIPRSEANRRPVVSQAARDGTTYLPLNAVGYDYCHCMTTTSNPADRLDSWKEIAVYLRRDVRTVQRWEKKEGLPVYRHQHDKLGSVFAFRPELAEWLTTRQPSTANVSAAQDKAADKIKLAVLPFRNLS